MKKIFGIVQARTDSSRLPGKVLKDIIGLPMIIHQLNRLSKSLLITDLILVTSEEKSDDVLATIVREHGYKVFRGSKNDVLKRFMDVLTREHAVNDDVVVRLTGDCPLHDSKIVDETIREYLKFDCDYITNAVEPIYPDGFDVEVFNFSSLKEAAKKAIKSSEREHVTPYIRNSGQFKIKNIQQKAVFPNWRLTVDEPEDLEIVKHIYQYFGNSDFSFNDIVDYLGLNTKLLNNNSAIKRNEGYLKSLKEDR